MKRGGEREREREGERERSVILSSRLLLAAVSEEYVIVEDL